MSRNFPSKYIVRLILLRTSLRHGVKPCIVTHRILVQWALRLGMWWTGQTMCGLRYTPRRSSAGFTATHAKMHGMPPSYTPRYNVTHTEAHTNFATVPGYRKFLLLIVK